MTRKSKCLLSKIFLFLRTLLLIYQIGDIYYIIINIMKNKYNGYNIFYPLVLELIICNIFRLKERRIMDENSGISDFKLNIIKINILVVLLLNQTTYYCPFYNVILIMLLL